MSASNSGWDAVAFLGYVLHPVRAPAACKRGSLHEIESLHRTVSFGNNYAQRHGSITSSPLTLGWQRGWIRFLTSSRWPPCWMGRGKRAAFSPDLQAAIRNRDPGVGQNPGEIVKTGGLNVLKTLLSPSRLNQGH